MATMATSNDHSRRIGDEDESMFSITAQLRECKIGLKHLYKGLKDDQAKVDLNLGKLIEGGCYTTLSKINERLTSGILHLVEVNKSLAEQLACLTADVENHSKWMKKEFDSIEQVCSSNARLIHEMEQGLLEEVESENHQISCREEQGELMMPVTSVAILGLVMIFALSVRF